MNRTDWEEAWPGKMIAILAVGVALAGVILTSLRRTEARLDAQIKNLRGGGGELREAVLSS